MVSTVSPLARRYRGKYPSRIRSVGTLTGRPGVMLVETNDFRQFEIARPTADAFPPVSIHVGFNLPAHAVPFRRDWSRAVAAVVRMIGGADVDFLPGDIGPRTMASAALWVAAGRHVPHSGHLPAGFPRPQSRLQRVHAAAELLEAFKLGEGEWREVAADAARVLLRIAMRTAQRKAAAAQRRASALSPVRVCDCCGLERCAEDVEPNRHVRSAADIAAKLPGPLLDAYRHRRARRAAYVDIKPERTAETCIRLARADVLAGRRFYASSMWATVRGFDPDQLARGLRVVGKVDPNGLAIRAIESMAAGYFLSHDGDYARDGSGLAWGEVWRLPSKRGAARFLPAVRNGDMDISAGPDFARHSSPNVWEAARRADQLAEQYAERERDYRAADLAGQAYAELADAVALERRDALLLLSGRRINGKLPMAACGPLARVVAKARARIAELRERMERLAEGRAERYPFDSSDPTNREAFRESAGLPA